MRVRYFDFGGSPVFFIDFSSIWYMSYVEALEVRAK